MISKEEIFVHGFRGLAPAWLPPLLGGRLEHHGGRSMWTDREEAITGRTEGEKEGGSDHQGPTLMTSSFQLGPTFK